MKNEIQKDDVTLPGGIGEVKYGNQTGEIIKLVSDKNSCTITVQPIQKLINGQWFEDAEFEVIPPHQITG